MSTPAAADISAPDTANSGNSDVIDFGATFTNDSAMMIAYERSLETKRGADALFQDPFAEALAGPKGHTLSDAFGAYGSQFGFGDWSEFHKTWTAVRTKFIDDQVAKYCGKCSQIVNLGAGMDMRAYRLDSYASFQNGCFEVDMAVVHDEKKLIFEKVLQNPAAKCKVTTINLDFLAEDQSLKGELATSGGFVMDKPTLFLAEGLIMYLGAVGKLKLIKDVSAVATPGSVFILQFLDPSEGPTAGTPAAAPALTAEEARDALTENGWAELQFWKFGDEGLNFGRFPVDKFEPCATFSFVVGVMK